jgi:hypothetical protein
MRPQGLKPGPVLDLYAALKRRSSTVRLACGMVLHAYGTVLACGTVLHAHGTVPHL